MIFFKKQSGMEKRAWHSHSQSPAGAVKSAILARLKLTTVTVFHRMIRRFFAVFTLFAASTFSYSQSAYPEGGYKNLEDLNNRNPSVHGIFQPQLRTRENLRMLGGNDYYMHSESDGITKEFIEKDIYAICADGTLYLNTVVHQLPAGYSKVLIEGRYIAFRSGFRDKKKRRITQAAMAMGLSGALIASLSKSKSGMERFLIALDTTSGTLSLLDRSFILAILQPYPEIVYQYALEQDQNSDETLLRYLKIFNGIRNP
jgi:hypothetical protein